MDPTTPKGSWSTSTGLTFAMDGDPSIQNTARKVARVPLSDYVFDSACPEAALNDLANFQLDDATLATSEELVSESSDPALVQLKGLCSELLRWQEYQIVQQPIDPRFRFRALLYWLASTTAADAGVPRRITSQATAFLIQHTRAQYALLRVEDENLQDMLEIRQHEGLPLSRRQEERVGSLDEEMHACAAAMGNVRRIVEIAAEKGLVVGEVDDGRSFSGDGQAVMEEGDGDQMTGVVESIEGLDHVQRGAVN